MTELMGDDALQFMSFEVFNGASGDCHNGVGGGDASGERVDAPFAVQYVDGRHRHIRSQCHFFDDIQAAPLRRIPGLWQDAGATQAFSNRLAAS